jgi:DoxX-like family
MNKNKIIFLVTTIFLFLFEGLMPIGTLIFKPEYATVGTQPLGYPDYFAIALIFCKMAGVLAILYTKTPNKVREWAYAGLTFNLLFAAYSHAMVDKNIGFILMPLGILGILAVSYIYKDKV